MTHTLHPESIDTLIATRLPAWLTAASAERLRALQAALRRQAAATRALGAVLAPIPSLQAFAEPLIDAALRKRGVADPDVRHSSVLLRQRIVLPSASPALPLPSYIHTSRQTLLGAALHNFHVSETKPTLGRSGQLENAQGKVFGMGFEAFAGLCRALNLGQAYQLELERHLRPQDPHGQLPGSAAASVQRLFEESLAANMEVAVRLALLKGEVDEQSYLQILPLIAPRPIVPPLPAPVQVRQLYLLGKCIRGVVTLEVHDHETGALSGVIAWVPGDPQQPVARYASWAALYEALAGRLRNEHYRAFFSRFITERDRARFFSRLAELLRALEPGASPKLDGRHRPVEAPLFAHLRDLQLEKIFDDARVLAVPTGDEDEQDRRERLDAWAALGFDLLSLAGLFVPTLGAGLLVLGALQVVDEVYEGYQDWSIGDRQGALDHLFNVAQSVVVGALTGASVSAGKLAVERLLFVDGLAPLRTDAGQLRLADSRLPGYHASAVSPGVGQAGRLLELPDITLQVFEDAQDGFGRVRHPGREKAHAPRVQQNAAGGWRHELEQPQHWQGAGLLLRRFGLGSSAVSDLLAERLLQVTGFDQAQMRQLHLESAAAPARLIEALERYQLHEQFPELGAQALDEQMLQRQPQASAEDQIVLAAFPGLPIRCVRELLGSAGGAELDSMLSRQRLPLTLAERARWMLREQRIDRACAGLRWPWARSADSEVLALALLGQSAPWPDSLRIELREGTAQGPLLAARGPLLAQRRRCVIRQQEQYHLDDSPLRSADLLETLLACLEDTQRSALGADAVSAQTLRERLLADAFAERGNVAALIGVQPAATGLRPPRRFADGRVGYALSGRGESSRQSIRRGIHQIFPTLSETQMNAYLEDLTGRGEGLWEHYSRLQEQLSQLRQALNRWKAERASPLEALRRWRVANAIRRSWRRKITDLGDDYVLEVDGESVGSLPVLPEGVDFNHVRRLRLTNLGLSSIEEDFLARFGNLVELDLSGNQLTAIPAGVARLSQLRQLRLAGNQIVMDAAGDSHLRALRVLQLLDLNRNPLGRAPALPARSRLRDVRLRATGLSAVPEELPWNGTVDLRENRIRQLRQDLSSLREQIDRLSLHDNPLQPASEALLDEAAGTTAGARGGASYRHRSIDDAVRDALIGEGTSELRAQRQRLWRTLRGERGSDALFRFLADFAGSEDFGERPERFRPRIWRILEQCEQHEALRARLFVEADGPRTCEDRLLLVLEQFEVTLLAELASCEHPGSQTESALVRLGRGLFRLDEVDRIAARHVRELERTPWSLVDEVEIQLYFRLKLARALGLPIEDDGMHYDSFANVSTSDLLRARREVLAQENSRVLAESLAQRPFWSAYVRHHYSERFEELAEQFHERLSVLQTQTDSAQIDEWTFNVRCQGLRYEYEVAESKLLRTLASEALARLGM